MVVQITNGQRYLLDLLQRKLLNTLQSYAKLSLERTNANQDDEDHIEHLELELNRLREKIRRMSARQKRFTLEIINGNGNNTIPKDCFFKALGLVTKETLNKLNSKTNERRRRSTANPRFSHEAIQAKRALEPLQKKLDSRISKEKRGDSTPATRGKATQKNGVDVVNKSSSSSTNNNNYNYIVSQNKVNNSTASQNSKSSSSTTNGNRRQQAGVGGQINTNNNQKALNLNNISDNASHALDRNSSGRNNRSCLTQQERRRLMEQFGILQKEISSKVSQIQSKKDNNKKLEEQNESIRKRGLDMISAINKIYQSGTFRENGQGLQGVLEQGLINSNNQSEMLLEPYDILLKCDESLEELD